MKNASHYSKIRDKISNLEKELLGFNQRKNWRNRLFDLSIDLLCVAGFDGYLRQLNTAWEKNLGWTSKELQARPWLEFVHTADKKTILDAIELQKKGEAVFDIEFRFKTKNNEWIWLSWNSYPIPEENIIFAISRNITQQKITHEKLLSSEERYRTYIKQSTEGICHVAFYTPVPVYLSAEEQTEMIYNEGYIFECNNVLAKMYGFKSCKEIYRRRLKEIYNEKDWASNLKSTLAFIKNNYQTPDSQIIEIVQPYGKKTFLNNAMGVIKDDKLIGIWGTQRDITEQRQAEYKLRCSEENYREIFNNFTEAIFLFDVKNSLVLDVNKTTLDMFGFNSTPEAIEFFNTTKTTEHEISNIIEVKKLIQKAAREKSQIFEWLTHKQDGRPFWAEVVLKAIELGGEKKVIAVVKDIDDRKYAQDMIKENERRYRTLFESSSDAIFIVSQKIVVDCNKKAVDVFMKERKEVIGQPVSRFIVSVYKNISIDEHYMTALEGKEQIIEWPCLRENNIPFEAEIKISPIELGSIKHLQIIIRDLSESKSAQRSIRISEQKFSGIFQVSPNAISITSLSDFAIIDINEAFQKLSGYSRNELIGKTWKELNLIQKKSQLKYMVGLFKKKLELTNVEFEYKNKQNHLITVLVSAKLIHVDRDDYILMIAHDITKRKKMERELQYHSQFEKLISEMSSRFINLPPEKIDDNIDKALEDICQFTNTNLGYVFKISEEWTKREIIHFYKTKSTSFKKTDFKVQNIKTMPWWMGKIADQKVLSISSPDELPPGAMEEKNLLITLGIQSLIEVPMIYRGRVFGVLGLGTTVQNRPWSENESALIRMAGQVFTNALHRKEVENALRENEERFRSIIQHLSDIVWIINDKGKVLFETPSTVRILGYEPGFLISKSGFDFIHPDDRNKLMREFNDVLERKNLMIPSEFRFLHKNGNWIELEVVANNMLHHEGIKGIIVTARDISGKKQAEYALRDSEKKYRNIFENIQDVYFEITPEGIITEISPSITSLTGYERNELIGKSVASIYKNPSDSALFLDKIETSLKISDFEIALNSVKGKERICSVNAELIYDDNKNPVKIFGTIRDITESKRLQAQLIQSQKLESIGTLAGGIAHDFNNLLTVILGHAELVSLKIDEKNSFHKDIISILNAGQKAELLTRQLLTFSRKQVYTPEILNINETIHSLDPMMCRLIGEDIHIEKRLDKNLPNIKANPGQIEQVLVNLLVNARDAIQDEKHKPDEKRIVLETGQIYLDVNMVSTHPGSTKGPHVFIYVSDTGIGMDEITKSKIFEPFFTTKEFHKGTGLGLSTVYGIVKQNQGSIYVYSEPGQGTTIKVFLPVCDKEETFPKKEIEIQNIQNGRETILLVEDDASVRAFAGAALRTFGYKIIEAADGFEAIRIARDNADKIDLVMTDVVMPGMNGKELSDHLSEITPEVKILFTSGYTDNHVVEKDVLNEKLNFLGKPYSTQALAKKIRIVLNS
ncbi:MAG: PAS domain S-box protein [Calditrichaceae bacterium]|nr:PAS domain S-box protein [Calditrichaceae bacterium]MBN2710457.1 PAS domain S-box protein [Calditrichaceae bacterium]RQV93608.1 MAG: PAS domain S-box protein [Calditrichota bacterium]